MANPYVTVDLRNHPRYQAEYRAEFRNVWTAEILSLNFNSGTARVRLYYPDSCELFVGNFDVDCEYIVQKVFEVNI